MFRAYKVRLLIERSLQIPEKYNNNENKLLNLPETDSISIFTCLLAQAIFVLGRQILESNVSLLRPIIFHRGHPHGNQL